MARLKRAVSDLLLNERFAVVGLDRVLGVFGTGSRFESVDTLAVVARLPVGLALQTTERLALELRVGPRATYYATPRPAGTNARFRPVVDAEFRGTWVLTSSLDFSLTAGMQDVAGVDATSVSLGVSFRP